MGRNPDRVDLDAVHREGALYIRVDAAAGLLRAAAALCDLDGQTGRPADGARLRHLADQLDCEAIRYETEHPE